MAGAGHEGDVGGDHELAAPGEALDPPDQSSVLGLKARPARGDVDVGLGRVGGDRDLQEGGIGEGEKGVRGAGDKVRSG